MMRSKLRFFEIRCQFILMALSVWLAFPVEGLPLHEDRDSVQVSSVKIYVARHIDTGEIAGHFWHVHARVRMTRATRSQLDLRVNVPTVLSPQLVVDGKHYLPCGSGGNLPRITSRFNLELSRSGEPISPLFYLPNKTLQNVHTIELIIGIRSGDWEQYKPVAQTPVTAARELLAEEKVEPLELIHVGTKDPPENKLQSGRQSMLLFRLRLPTGLTRVLGGGTGRLFCGTVPAEGINVGILGDVVDSWFTSSIDVSKCSWEVRFPSLGVKLELGVAKPRVASRQPSR